MNYNKQNIIKTNIVNDLEENNVYNVKRCTKNTSSDCLVISLVYQVIATIGTIP